jgi:TolB protein
MGIRTVLLSAALAVAVGLGCVVFLLASARSAEASFPGNNGLIAFSARDDDGTYEIFTTKLDGSSLKQRTNADGSSAGPSWSPDGTKIAFSSNRDGHDSEIYVKDITTGKVTQITDNFENRFDQPIDDFFPAWSPDGTKIAFERTDHGDDTGCYRMFVIDVDGSNEKPLYSGCWNFIESWSPDGSWIAYNCRGFSDDFPDICVIRPDGSESTNLTNTRDLIEGGVDWKPNGKKIVFEREGDIWKMSPDGSHKDRLTFSQTFSGGRNPLWSPNGREIIFFRGSLGSQDLWKMNPDGSNKTDIPDPPSQDLDWQPIPTP